MEPSSHKAFKLLASSRLLRILTAAALVTSITAVLLASIALNLKVRARQTVSADDEHVNFQRRNLLQFGGGIGPKAAPRIFMISIGHDYGPYDYVNDKGYLQGFHMDLITAVCDAGGMICRTIWDPYPNCWKGIIGQPSRGGKGLMNRWFDTCMGWYVTVHRIHVFDYSKTYLKPQAATFYIKNGNTFSNDEVKNNKIAFIDGWANDERCLASRGDKFKLKPDQVKHYVTPDKFVDAIVRGEVYAGWAGVEEMNFYQSDEFTTDRNQRIKPVGDTYMCMLKGNGMMTQKNNDFPNYWNRGFDAIVSTGKFKKICVKANQDHRHRGMVDCIDT